MTGAGQSAGAGHTWQAGREAEWHEEEGWREDDWQEDGWEALAPNLVEDCLEVVVPLVV